MEKIHMVDLTTLHQKLKSEIDAAMQKVIDESAFIKGNALSDFEFNLANYLGSKHVIGVANGTDALQIALMALNLKPGDEVIVPAFTYVATAEVIGLLGLIPVMVDVNEDHFCIDIPSMKSALTSKTKAIVPVHLFGQSAPMEEIINFANENRLYIIEDNAQALGATYTFSDKSTKKTGTMAHIGCTSFFPSKNLGCFGDGGAIMTQNDELAEKIKMIANHGQSKKYVHDVLGVNSRLDTIQAAVLDVKLKYLDDFSERRNGAADYYDNYMTLFPEIELPRRVPYSNHVFHQYTIRVKNGKRDALKDYLNSVGIPSMVYYPIPLYKQKAFAKYHVGQELPMTEKLCNEVLSLPIHTEMKDETQKYILDKINNFYFDIFD
jgi:UDP-2-acetamido-2-deoxy-ribo-hexuluronate aminotransferase